MRDAYQDRPRRPLRETVCEMDRDILRLVMRRHNMLKRMAGPKGHLDNREEKQIRESWESAVAKVSNDPKLSGLFFSLMQEVTFLPKPGEDGEQRREAFNLAPVQQPVKLDMDAPASCRATRAWLSLAAGSGQHVKLAGSLMNDAVFDCLKMFNQMGASIIRDGDAVEALPATPCQTPDKVIFSGASSFNFYLALGHYLGRPSHAKFSGDSQMRMEGLDAVVSFVPQLGARLVHVIPKGEGLPVRIESSGMLPDAVDFPDAVPFEFIEGMLLAAPFYEKPVVFRFGSHPDRARIEERILPLLAACGAQVEGDCENLHITPSKLALPREPKLAMEPELAVFLLALAPALSGRVRLAGQWPGTADAEAAKDLFRQAGLQVEAGPAEVSLQCGAELRLPEAGLELPEALPAAWLPLAMALTCLGALKNKQARMPRGCQPGGEGFAEAEAFARACGLEIQEDGAVVWATPFALKRDAGEGGEREELVTIHQVWPAPSAAWACALAVCACARPEPHHGFRLNNPGILTTLYPGFWALYNALPEPQIRKPEAQPQPKERRRIRTSAQAQLTPREENEE
ncbi:MAG: 3-phosphoshikimate 1-carboxyvinyltransferase [Desulfovibrio sp.]|nr:3-phosphoshikimate 1-carboxyvinyltransferase [Desulfovibrio sp.]